eukprot:2202204-Pyramimonas_sp.AAC.1
MDILGLSVALHVEGLGASVRVSMEGSHHFRDAGLAPPFCVEIGRRSRSVPRLHWDHHQAVQGL